MRIFAVLFLAGLILSVPGCRSDDPPVARVVPHELEVHGQVRVDNYYWLRERENPDVIAYLNAENDYSEQALAHTKDLQEQIFDEIVGRIIDEWGERPKVIATGGLAATIAAILRASTRFIICLNLATGVPTSGRCDSSQCPIGWPNNSSVWAARLGRTGAR